MRGELKTGGNAALSPESVERLKAVNEIARERDALSPWMMTPSHKALRKANGGKALHDTLSAVANGGGAPSHFLTPRKHVHVQVPPSPAVQLTPSPAAAPQSHPHLRGPFSPVSWSAGLQRATHALGRFTGQELVAPLYDPAEGFAWHTPNREEEHTVHVLSVTPSSGADGVVRFNVVLERAGRQWVIARRYSHWRYLAGTIQSKLSAPFPPKVLMSWVRAGLCLDCKATEIASDAADVRARSLQLWAMEVCSAEVINNEEVISFFEL